ncbi:hypothetical protein ACEPAI_4520 [Sanghuangporus weigelae]
MTSKHFHVTGIPAVGTDVPLRKNFDDFAKDTDVLNLYLLALDRIQNDEQSVLTSFFQIAGIHGKPYIPWDNVQGLNNPTFGGYCTHGSVIFPTWHRPYVALYEQVVWDQASLIANSYEDPALKNKYREALKRLRQPYYDWAANTTLHPLLNNTETVSVVSAPGGQKRNIRNPLLGYKFHPVDPSFDSTFAVWPQTLRYPTSNNADAKSQPDKVQNAMDSRGEQLRDNTFDLLAFNQDWVTFSNHTSSGNSLESIHDQVHVLIGGNGHMANIPMAGFDPIFFLHHTNVDRLLSLWQALNPTLWVVPGSSEDGSFTVPPGKQIDVNTDLTPFHIDDVTYWISANSRDTKSFGYTYPEVSNTDASPEELRQIVMRAVMDLYGPQSGISEAAQTAEPSASLVQSKSRASGVPPANPGHEQSAPPSNPPPYPNRYHDWFATVTVNPYQFAGSGYVHFFLTDTVPSGNWMFAPERVGDVGVFRNTSGQCANCSRSEAAGETITGHVPLTRVLMQKGKDINNVEDIRAYLKKHLHWRCALADGTEVPLDGLPSLQVKLCSALCERQEPRGGFEGFPRRHTPEVHRSVTHGKVGGYGLDDN